MRQYSFIQKFYNERFLTTLDKVQFARVHLIVAAFIAINLIQHGLFLKIVERAAQFRVCAPERDRSQCGPTGSRRRDRRLHVRTFSDLGSLLFAFIVFAVIDAIGAGCIGRFGTGSEHRLKMVNGRVDFNGMTRR